MLWDSHSLLEQPELGHSESGGVVAEGEQSGGGTDHLHLSPLTCGAQNV